MSDILLVLKFGVNTTQSLPRHLLAAKIGTMVILVPRRGVCQGIPTLCGSPAYHICDLVKNRTVGTVQRRRTESGVDVVDDDPVLVDTTGEFACPQDIEKLGDVVSINAHLEGVFVVQSV